MSGVLVEGVGLAPMMSECEFYHESVLPRPSIHRVAKLAWPVILDMRVRINRHDRSPWNGMLRKVEGHVKSPAW